MIVILFPMEELEKYLEMVRGINYDNREGGRYAYVQLMVYLREISLMLESIPGYTNELILLGKMSDQLNELVPERFGPVHKHIFDEQRSELTQLFQLKLKVPA